MRALLILSMLLCAFTLHAQCDAYYYPHTQTYRLQCTGVEKAVLLINYENSRAISITPGRWELDWRHIDYHIYSAYLDINKPVTIELKYLQRPTFEYKTEGKILRIWDSTAL
jgi:hypothetical protein